MRKVKKINFLALTEAPISVYITMIRKIRQAQLLRPRDYLCPWEWEHRQKSKGSIILSSFCLHCFINEVSDAWFDFPIAYISQ